MSARIWKTRRNKPVKVRSMTITSYDGRPLKTKDGYSFTNRKPE